LRYANVQFGSDFWPRKIVERRRNNACHQRRKQRNNQTLFHGGLLTIFSLGMDTLAEELKGHDVYATVDSYSDWQTLADQAAADYKARKEAPIILIGHSLGADAVMEMAAYLGRKGVPVALVVPFEIVRGLR
jgi:pimeloyl-ACP methyl ester carboxylesterase